MTDDIPINGVNANLAMRRTIGWLAALFLPVILLAGPAVAQKKAGDKDADKDKDSDKPAEKWVKVGTLTARIVAMYEDKRKLRVQVVPGKVNTHDFRLTGSVPNR